MGDGGGDQRALATGHAGFCFGVEGVGAGLEGEADGLLTLARTSSGMSAVSVMASTCCSVSRSMVGGLMMPASATSSAISVPGVRR
jgi:hypothetical protein